MLCIALGFGKKVRLDSLKTDIDAIYHFFLQTFSLGVIMQFCGKRLLATRIEVTAKCESQRKIYYKDLTRSENKTLKSVKYT